MNTISRYSTILLLYTTSSIASGIDRRRRHRAEQKSTSCEWVFYWVYNIIFKSEWTENMICFAPKSETLHIHCIHTTFSYWYLTLYICSNNTFPFFFSFHRVTMTFSCKWKISNKLLIKIKSRSFYNFFFLVSMWF